MKELQMSRLLRLTLGFTVALAMAMPAVAQTSATVVLRSGERISGDLVDMGAGGFEVRVGGNPRKIPTGDVAVIDFAGGAFPASELNQIPAGRHLIVLSNGQAVVGRLYDIGGTSPKRISVDTDGGRKDFSSNEIRRIYLANPSGASRSAAATSSSTPAPLPATGGEIRVAGNQRWVDTGLTVRKGDLVSFSPSGQIQFSSDPKDTATPAGSTAGKRPAGGPMPNVLLGALIGRVGPVGVFAIGNQNAALPMPADGRLFLGVNDDNVTDNSGEFVVTVRPQSPLTRRR
jgi:hypothetical protein